MSDPSTITVNVNGQTRTIRAGGSLKDLITEAGLLGQPVAAEVNKIVIPFRKHEAHILHDGDVIELVTLVGGG